MRAILWAVAAVLLGLCATGCAVPDDPNETALRRVIGDDLLHDVARRWTMKRVAIRTVSEAIKSSGSKRLRLGHMECREFGAGKWGAWTEEIQMEKPPSPGDDPELFTGGNILDVFAPDVLMDLMGDSALSDDQTYQEIVDHYNESARDHASKRKLDTGKKTQCKYVWVPGFAPDEMPKAAMDPSDEDIEKELLRSPLSDIPASIAAALAGIISTGSPVPIFVLCPLGAASPCPPSADRLPGATPPPDQGGAP